MVVAFTPNIGLAKPDETELALNWTRSTKLQEDNNLIIVDKTDINLVQYTPVFGATTTVPNVGTGSLDGEYREVQGWIDGKFVIEFFDAGITSGSGEYGVSLPFPADAIHIIGTSFAHTTPQPTVIGEGYIWDNSSVGNSGSCALDVVTVGGVSYARFQLETFAGKTSRVFRDSMPFAFATNDKLTGSYLYKRV